MLYSIESRLKSIRLGWNQSGSDSGLNWNAGSSWKETLMLVNFEIFAFNSWEMVSRKLTFQDYFQTISIYKILDITIGAFHGFSEVARIIISTHQNTFLFHVFFSVPSYLYSSEFSLY